MKMCSRICVHNMKKMRRRILHKNMHTRICIQEYAYKNMCSRQTSLHPTIFVSSSFLFIVKDDAARDLIFSDPYITKHSKVHCNCKYLSLSPQQWSLYEHYIFVSVCVSSAGSPLLISLSSLPFFCHSYSFCLSLCHCLCLLFYFFIVIVILFVFAS